MSEPGDLPAPDETTRMPSATAGATAGEYDLAPIPKPWYKRPGPLTALVLGAVALLGLGGFFLYQALDEDDPSTVSILRFERVDQNGDPIVREIEGAVVGVQGDELDFLWLRPPNASAPLPAIATTSESSGLAEFRWGPTDAVAEPETWTSTIVLREVFGAEESLVDTEIPCSLQRRGEDAGTILLLVTFDNPADLTAPRTATYTFPGEPFLAGDVVRCIVPNGPSVAVGEDPAPPATTIVEEPAATTTVAETTTTVAATTTTVAETTTTTAAETTTTTVAETTTTAPPADTSVLSLLQSRSDLSRLAELVTTAGLEGQLSDPAATLTLFAPNNAAFDALLAGPEPPDLVDAAVARNIVLTHLHATGELSSADVLALSEVTVEEGGPHAVDASVSPPTIGGSGIIETDLSASNGFVHVLNAVIVPTVGS